jgi:hypothetical protein
LFAADLKGLMEGSMKTGICCAAALAALSLAACDQRLASQPARDHDLADSNLPSAATPASYETAPAAAAYRAPAARRDDTAAPVPLVGGKPEWADNRQHSAQDNAQYQFDHHGKELGARDLDDFVVRVHRFVDSPPQGVLTLTRANGDRLMFDPKSGLFGVVRSDGAPRTVFKPQEGRAYWDQQVATGQNCDQDPFQEVVLADHHALHLVEHVLHQVGARLRAGGVIHEGLLIMRGCACVSRTGGCRPRCQPTRWWWQSRCQ